jgi:hypothetical protein
MSPSLRNDCGRTRLLEHHKGQNQSFDLLSVFIDFIPECDRCAHIAKAFINCDVALCWLIAQLQQFRQNDHLF